MVARTVVRVLVVQKTRCFVGIVAKRARIRGSRWAR